MLPRPGLFIFSYINDLGPQGQSDGSDGAAVQVSGTVGGVESSGVGVSISCPRPSAEAALSGLQTEDSQPPDQTNRSLNRGVHRGRQGKHQREHNNFQPGGSVLLADPDVLARRAGTGERVGRVAVGDSGSKERVLFDHEIGYYVDLLGRAQSTRVGIIHYSQDGIHIVPARPT